MAYRNSINGFVFNPNISGMTAETEAAVASVVMALFVLLCISLLYRFYRTHNRRNIIEDFSEKHNMTYLKRRRIDQIYKDFKVSVFSLFNGFNTFAHNLMTGKLHGYTIVLFDFHPFDISHSQHSGAFPCAAFILFYDPLPDFSLSPVNLFKIRWQQRLLRNYKSPNKDFNKNFICQYEENPHKVFLPKREFVEYMANHGQDICIEKKQNHLLIYSKKVKASEHDYEQFINQSLKIYKLLTAR